MKNFHDEFKDSKALKKTRADLTIRFKDLIVRMLSLRLSSWGSMRSTMNHTCHCKELISATEWYSVLTPERLVILTMHSNLL